MGIRGGTFSTANHCQITNNEDRAFEQIVDGRIEVDPDDGRVYRIGHAHFDGSGEIVPCDRRSIDDSVVGRRGEFAIRIDGVSSTVRLSRLVYRAILGPIPDGMCVMHIDGDFRNNAPTNLRAASHRECVGTATAGRLAKDKPNRKDVTEMDGTVLYHFTAPQFVNRILREGIRLGAIPRMPRGRLKFDRGCQWLTDDPSFDDQEWATGTGALPYDRSAIRMKIVIPRRSCRNLKRWSDVAGDDPLVADLNAAGSPDRWFIYRGRIPAAWILEVQRKPEAE